MKHLVTWNAGSSGVWQEKGREKGGRDICRDKKGWRRTGLGGDAAGEAAQVPSTQHKKAVWHQG